uniref:Uncharacterized protein n=1 Tax=Anopheles arabiensis TaxID=7173 RepID=A0A8W7MTI3_ANOAR
MMIFLAHDGHPMDRYADTSTNDCTTTDPSGLPGENIFRLVRNNFGSEKKSTNRRTSSSLHDTALPAGIDEMIPLSKVVERGK